MAIQDDFEAAVERSTQLSERPSNDDLLELYGLYKQATAGDVSGDEPGMFDFKGRAKWDAWSAKQGMASEDAMQAYVALVDTLAAG